MPISDNLWDRLKGALFTGDVAGTQNDGLPTLRVHRLPANVVGTQRAVGGATGNTVLLAGNQNRKAVLVFNDSPANLYLNLGGDATIGAAPSNSRFSVRLTASAYYELPPPVWTGTIAGVWDGPSGAAQLTEVT